MVSSVSDTTSVAGETATPRSRKGRVRPFERGDLEVVTRMFQSTFGGDRIRVPADGINRDLCSYIEQLYFTSPRHGSQAGSQVYVDADGQVSGFLGLIEDRYLVEGTELRTGHLSAFMVNEPERRPMAGPTLVREIHNNSELDLLLSDSVNNRMLRFAIALRNQWQIMPRMGLDWMAVFRPASLGLFAAQRRFSWLPGRLLAAPARLGDRIAGRMLPGGREEATGSGHSVVVLSHDEFVALAPTFIERYALRPLWQPQDLSWYVTEAGRKQKAGPLHLLAVHDRAGQAIGCVAVYARPGGVAQVLQTLARADAWEPVLTGLLDWARDYGCIAARGPSHPELLVPLFLRKGIMFHHMGASVGMTRDPQIRQLLDHGDILTGGLAGDRWTRLASDIF